MDTQPKIPTLKDSQKPQVKVRGLEAGVTLFDRLKQFKKKDLAFILAGLGTLFMAPLAEHFMMSPEAGDSSLQPGWGGGKGGPKGMFDGSGANVYEPGVSGLAPGQQVGGGSDIITPLNVRDPSALVMGPGATQQPPTSSVMPSTPPPTAVATHSDSDLKDALAASARGVTSAAHAVKALLPMPKIALSGGSGLRGLGVVSGGSSASGGGISSAGLAPSSARQGNNLGGVTGAHGVTATTRGQTGGGSGALDKLKAAGDAAGGAFNRGGANAALNEAANTAIPTGGGSLGGNGAGLPGGTDKPDAGNQSKDGKNVGESLAFLKQKAMQDAQIALWAKEQEAGDNKLELLKIRNQMAEAITTKIGGAVGDAITCPMTAGKSFKTCWGPSSGLANYWCTPVGGGANQPYPSANITVGTVCPANDPTKSGSQFTLQGSDLYPCPSGAKLATNCSGDAPGSPNSSPAGGPQTGTHDIPGAFTQAAIKDIVSYCATIDKTNTDLSAVTPAPAYITKVKTYLGQLKGAAGLLVSARDALYYSGAGTGDCGAAVLMSGTAGGTTAAGDIKTAVTKLGGAAAPTGPADAASVIGKMKGLVAVTDPTKVTPDQFTDYDAAVTSYKHAQAIIAVADPKLNTEYKTAIGAATFDATGVADVNLPAKMTDLKNQLDGPNGIQSGLVINLNAVKGANDTLKTQLNQVGSNIGKSADDSGQPNGSPILGNLVAQNADYKAKVGYGATPPANPPANPPAGPSATPDSDAAATSLAGTVKKIDTNNASLVIAADAAALKVNVTWPAASAAPQAAVGSDVVNATGLTKTSLGKVSADVSSIGTPGASVISPVAATVHLNTAPATAVPVTPNTSLTSALTDFGDSTTNRGKMQASESTWLDTIQSGLPNTSNLPAPK